MDIRLRRFTWLAEPKPKVRRLSAFVAAQLRRDKHHPSGDVWWAMTDSNRRHSRCKRDALPTELIAPFNRECALLAERSGAVKGGKERDEGLGIRE